MAFAQDLEAGLDVEKRVLEILQRKYPCATIVNAFKGYDIWIPELEKGIEVKSDKKSQETGNIVIEIEFNGKPSALMTTKAAYWIFYDGEKFVSIEPMEIIKCIFMNKLKYAEFVGNGDTKSKKAFLVRKDVLFSYGKEIK
jgi:hypothetical protein